MELPELTQLDPATTVCLRLRPTPESLAGRAEPRVDAAITSAAATALLGHELQVAADPGFTDPAGSTGPVPGERQLDLAVPGGPLTSREQRFVRARVATAAGWSPWSEALRIEAGLLAAADWTATAITLAGDPGGRRQSPSPLLRKAFRVDGDIRQARLHVTSCGLHELRINGHRVGDQLLAPGWSVYRERLLVIDHDVAELLTSGENVIAGLLGDGWYRGRLGWDPTDDRCRYGDTLALLAQLEVELADGTRLTVGTDPSWRASTGELRSADLYDGCTIDLRERHNGWDAAGFDDSGWAAAAAVPLSLDLLQPQLAPPVRVVATLTPTRTETTNPAGATVIRLDAGQNVSGVVRFTARGAAGDAITIRHAEVLEADGALHTVSLRSAKATDHYTLAGPDPVTLEPAFTFHGFRYAELELSRPGIEIGAAEVLVISSDTAPRGEFHCSDAALSRFHENVVWSQRDNFVSVPTDCPQRDERLGWTGDAQAFAATACTLFDAQSFWTSWLVDLAIDQAHFGGVPSVVPNVIGDGVFAIGRAGWADAATIVPWAVHRSYDDPAVLARQLPSMVAHVAYLQARRGPNGLLGNEFQFGDWLDPDAPGERPHEAKTASDYLANAFFSHSARLVARAAELLGDPATASRHDALADELAAATWQAWREHALTTQTGCAVAIELGIASPADRAVAGERLAALVRAAAGRIATGFLGTPLVLPALTATGHLAEAYLMLLRHEMPSWLYQVDRGATTVWERWDAIRPDGSIHDGIMKMPDGDGHMLSFNHYAYGAVIDWVYRSVAGIALDEAAPGYRHVVLAPHPAEAITEVDAAVRTGYGEVSVSWQLDATGDWQARYQLPFGVTATLRPPVTAASQVTVDGAPAGPEVSLGPGSHEVRVSSPEIVRTLAP